MVLVRRSLQRISGGSSSTGLLSLFPVSVLNSCTSCWQLFSLPLWFHSWVFLWRLWLWLLVLLIPQVGLGLVQCVMLVGRLLFWLLLLM